MTALGWRRLRTTRLVCAVAFASVTFAAAPALADDWQLIKYVDAFVGETVLAAQNVTEDGYSVTIFRNADTMVRWVLATPDDMGVTFPRIGMAATIFVDQVVQIDFETDPDVPAYRRIDSRGGMLRAPLWHGEGPSPTSGMLRNMLDGEVLAIRFFPAMGDPLNVAFPLGSQGASVIARAIDIDVDADPAAIAAEGAEAEALAKAIDVCIDAGDRMGACLDALTECADGIPVLTDDLLRACMTDAGFPRQ